MKKFIFITFFGLSIFAVEDCKSKQYGIVMAGGGGKRLWPLSRSEKPKQFITLHDSKTLLETTLERIKPLTTPGCMCVVTTDEHEKSVKKYGQDKIDIVINEPAARNTAPAILLTVMEIYQKDPNAVIFFVPADHYIPDNQLFKSALKQATQYAHEHDQIVLIGIQPHRPATEYGYIEYQDQVQENVFKVKNFHEKPILERAEEYLKMDTMLWNTGIFCGKVSIFLDEYKKYAPRIVESMELYKAGKITYAEIAEESFDKAVLEKTDKCTVVPACFKWSDVGNLEQFVIAKQEKAQLKNVVSHLSGNNLVDGAEKLVVLLGVHDLCVIETQDVLLISSRHETDKVKDILVDLKKVGLEDYL